MTEEVREELAPVETQEIATDDDAAFLAGFEAGLSGEDKAPEVPVEEPKEEPKPVEPEAPPIPTPEELIAQARADLMQEIAKVRDTSAGRLGEVNQRMQQLLNQQQSSGGSGVKLTKESLKRLSSEYGEMAEMLAEDLSEAFAHVGGSQQIDPSVIDQHVSQRVAAAEEKMTKEMEKFKLSTWVSDWEEKVQSEAFRTWLGGQPLDYQNQIGNSWNAREIADALKKFDTSTQTANQQAQQRKQRMADAVTPTQATQSAPAPSTEDDFVAGFNRRGR